MAGNSDDEKGVLERGESWLKEYKVYMGQLKVLVGDKGRVEVISCCRRRLKLMALLVETTTGNIELWNWNKVRTKIILREGYETWTPSAGWVPRSYWNNCERWQSKHWGEVMEPEAPAQTSAKPIRLRGASHMPASSSAPTKCCQAGIQIQLCKGYVFFQTNQCAFILRKIPQL